MATVSRSFIITALKSATISSLFVVASLAQAELKTLEQKASYAVGINFANSVKMQGIKLDADSVVQGIKDGLSGKQTALTVAQMQEALTAYKEQLINQQKQQQSAQSAENKKAGNAFLWFEMGNCQYELGITSKARESYRRSLEIDNMYELSEKALNKINNEGIIDVLIRRVTGLFKK